MTLSHLSSYDRTGAQSLINGARANAPPNAVQGGLSAEEDPPVGPPESTPSQTIDVRPTGHAPAPQGTVRQDFTTLVDAVSQGNLIGARSALESLQGHSPGLYEASGKPSTAGSPFSNEMDDLMKALRSGDEVGAKSALGRLEKEMQAAHDRRRWEDNPVAGGLTAIGHSGDRDADGDSARANAADRDMKSS